MNKKLIIAGGGTGGHIFPAIAIANALRRKDPLMEILFVGAKDRMEMEKVPQAGYKIEGLDIAGFNRSSLIKNVSLPFKLLKSFLQARRIMRQFKPDVVVGVGGYASFPMLRLAQQKRIPTVIQEQNSFAGKTNKILGRKAAKVCVASSGMEKFFPAEKIVHTGNPVRESIAGMKVTRDQAIGFFSLDHSRKTLLIVGGSLGARSINEAIDEKLDELLAVGLQVIWQTGKPYAERAKKRTEGKKGVWVKEFIMQMEYAYAAADIVVSRAGAIAISELCVVGKPVVFVPYPFAAEDHQTENARSLVNQDAALMVKDSEVKQKLAAQVIQLMKDAGKQSELKKNISKLGIHDADDKIAKEILDLIK